MLKNTINKTKIGSFYLVGKCRVKEREILWLKQNKNTDRKIQEIIYTSTRKNRGKGWKERNRGESEGVG